MLDPRLKESPHEVSTRTLREFAGLCILFFGAIGCWQWLARGRPVAGLALGTLAAALGLLGLVRPRGLRPVFVGWMSLTAPIGWLVSGLILAVLFYGFFTPIGLLFKLFGRDPLAREFPTGQATYWIEKLNAKNIQSYFRQS